ncbi:MAG: sugar phosphate isomerase/epimerase [Proteobacteria bacterium]|nr:sugar phosphate isomerase/epimerase [Pseudomonadota bacterium]
MYLTGFTDEASYRIDIQIKATLELGWKNIESRSTEYGNIGGMTDEHFDLFAGKLSEAGIRVNCYGSGIANWSQDISSPPNASYEELERALPRLNKLGTTLVRVMSFKCAEDASVNTREMEAEVVKRMKRLVEIAEDGGVVLVHENCDNWGGRSHEHTLRLLDAIPSPNFRLVFDTGNPVFRKNIPFDSTQPFPYQDALDYYRQVKEFVEYVHIKDGRVENGEMTFTFPGEGDGHVEEICANLFQSGYDGGISIEPHMMMVFHDKNVENKAELRYDNYIEYGRRMERIVQKAGWK